MLGMNDLNITGLEGTCEKYKELIGKIEESSPDAEINIMSMTYVLEGKGVYCVTLFIIHPFPGYFFFILRQASAGYLLY